MSHPLQRGLEKAEKWKQKLIPLTYCVGFLQKGLNIMKDNIISMCQLLDS